MKKLRPLIDLILYGDFWIAAAAIAMTLQTQFVVSGTVSFTPLVAFIGFSTWMLYALHRIIGLKKVRIFTDTGRYAVIERYKKHILFYAVLGGVGAVISFFFLSFRIQAALVLPALISLGYVMPVLGGEKRLRDLNNLKIYLIAVVWAWITVALPLLDMGKLLIDIPAFLLLIFERMLFVFAITLPFDIRDLKVDGHTGVKTIPTQIGIKRTKTLASIVFFIVLILAATNFLLNNYSLPVFIAFAISCASANWLVQRCDQVTDDYYFTGLIDGTMVLQFILVYWASIF